MPHTLTLVTSPHTNALQDALLHDLQSITHAGSIHWQQDGIACDLSVEEDTPQIREAIAARLEKMPIDWCLQPTATRRKKLLICDMDSTIIQQECIDELAALAGIGDQVAAITERAMRGELDFAQSLTERVALLKGLPETTLIRVWEERIQLTPGAEPLIRTMNAHGAHTMLVSGGFTFFTSRVAKAVGFQAHHANTLAIEDGTLTGTVIPPILDKASKQHLLQEAMATHGLEASDTLAVGDGANDAAMITAAGLGVAYRAKPLLQQQAHACINYTDLRTLLYFQNIR